MNIKTYQHKLNLKNSFIKQKENNPLASFLSWIFFLVFTSKEHSNKMKVPCEENLDSSRQKYTIDS